MNELGTRARQELEPAWDDVREARLLSRILADADQSRFRWSRLAGGVAAVATAAALVVGIGRFVSPATEAKAPIASPASAQSAPALAGSSLLSLADGSKAHLRPGAVLEPLEQTRQVVRIAQRQGEVRYEVKPDAGRPFTVQARDVEVRVIGTVFTVNVESDGVRVSVERGRVAVKSGERRVELSPGETLRLSTADSVSTSTPTGGEKVTDTRGAPTETTEASPMVPVAASPVELLAEADAARGRGDLATAERLLGTLIAKHPQAPQAPSARFSLGRIQTARGNFAAAARTFQALRRQVPSGPLAEDTLAEAANASALSGQTATARSLADQYLKQYPSGAHAERMRRLGKP
jgi:transmembrane sensor